ncbi:hypothetical protein [Phenylobacterium sp.]|uniref:hypothetical protein n=1 Tax=Phenylobacterium sp. TaxID=1871053 RepID=UPI0025D5F0EC|nr:hypothetical protein [Phenylobacterium sp.]
MVLAWIAWRTFSEVREWDAEYVPMRLDWGPLEPQGSMKADSGYGLFRRKRPTSAQFLKWGGRRFGPWIMGGDGRPAVFAEATPADAMLLMRRSLEDGELVAHGLRRVDAARVEIPAREWMNMQIVSDRDGGEELRCGSGPNPISYRDALFLRSSVLSIWLNHARSGLPERSDPELTRVIEDPAIRRAVFEKVKAEALFDNQPRTKAKSRGLKDGDLPALIAVIKQSVSDGHGLLTFDETVEWGEDEGLSRESVRTLRRRLPANLKRSNTDWRR